MYSPTNMRRSVLFAIIRYLYIVYPFYENEVTIINELRYCVDIKIIADWYLIILECKGIDTFDLVKWDSI